MGQIKDIKDSDGDYQVKVGWPESKVSAGSESEVATADAIHAEIAAAIEAKDPEKLADSYNKLISQIKSEGDARYVIQPDSPKSVRENANTYLEWSRTMPKIDAQKASFMFGSQEKFSSNTMDQTNKMHGDNPGFRNDPLVVEDSHLAASEITGFLNTYKSPYFQATVSEKAIAIKGLSPYTIDLFLGRKRPTITVD
jgi:hypothetical protein